MNLAIQILYLSSFITPLLAPLLYKCKRPKMVDFYRRMSLSSSFRSLYTLMVTLYLLAFHFYHLSIYNHPTWLIPSTILTLLTYSHSFCEQVFNLIQNKRTLLGVTFAAIVCMLFPMFMPLGFTMIVLAVAAVFYPSRLHRTELITIAQKRDLWKNDTQEAIFRYFRWDLMEGFVKAVEVDSDEATEAKDEPMVEQMTDVIPLVAYLDSLDEMMHHRKPTFHPDAIEDAEYTEIKD